MRTILHIILKEFIQLRRDRKMFPIIFIAPVLQLVLLGYAANMDVATVSTVVCDMDRTQASRAFLSTFAQSDIFTLDYDVEQLRGIDPIIDNGLASMAIVVPRGFGARLLSGRPAQVQVIADGTDTITATLGLNSAVFLGFNYSRMIILKSLERLRAAGISPASVDPRLRVWFNPELKSRKFMIPGVLGLLLMVITLMLTSLAVVKEKEIGTLEQLIVTPIRPYQLTIGKLAPFAILGMIDVVIVILVATFWFDIPVKGSILLLFVLCGVYLMTTLGLGLFVSTISRTQQQAMLTAIFFVMMPMIIISGFVFPIENMPLPIQTLTYLLPPRYFFVIIRGIFLKGVGIAELWDEVLPLILFGTGILFLSIMRFQKRLT